MYLLRRAALRAVSSQPSRPFTAAKSFSTPISRQWTPRLTITRCFTQQLSLRADEVDKRDASPAEAESSGETVTTEPSAEEQKELDEISVAEPATKDAAPESTSDALPAAVQREASDAASDAVSESVGSTAQPEQTSAHEEQTFTEQVKDYAFSAAQTAQSATSSAAGAARRVAGAVTGERRERRAPRDQAGDLGPPMPSKILYVGNLFFEVTAQQLEAEFGRFGAITNSRVVADSRGLSKGFAYVEFENLESAENAVKELDQKVLEGRRMAVQFHVRREPRVVSSIRASTPSKTLFIGNMSYQMSDRDLNDLFREVRNVLDVRVAIDRRSGQPRGFAHADFVDVSSAERAKEMLEKKVVYGRTLRVDFSDSSARTQNA